MLERIGSVFGKMFGIEQTKKPAQPELSNAEKEAQIASRRNFMKGMGAVGAAFVAEKFIPTAEAAEKKLTASPEIEHAKLAEKHEQETFEQAYQELKNFSKEFKLKHSDRHTRTTEELDIFHQTFNELFSDSIVNTLLLAKKLNRPTEIEAIYKILKECNALGHYYNFITKLPSEEQQKMNVDFEWNFDRFQSQAVDFLPNGQQVQDSEIDPRLLQIVTQYEGGELLYPAEARVSVMKNIQDKPGWTDPERTQNFRTILNNPKVRELFIASDCSLAEVYSIIKAAIKTKRLPDETFFPEIVIQEKLIERETLKTKEILGPNTETFIHFTLNDPVFDPEVTKQLAALATIWNKGEKSIVHKIKNDKERGIKNYIPVKGEVDPIITDFGNTIEKSQGKTLIYIGTHGSDQALGLHQNDAKNILSTGELAKCLLRLVDTTKNPNALANITILNGACHNYDFTKFLIRDLRAAYIGNPNDLALPTVITSTQEGSLADTNGFGGEVLKKYLPAIAREKKLTGEFLMRRMQAEAYLFGDATFFTTKQNGQWQEIGENERQSSTSQTA